MRLNKWREWLGLVGILILLAFILAGLYLMIVTPKPAEASPPEHREQQWGTVIADLPAWGGCMTTVLVGRPRTWHTHTAFTDCSYRIGERVPVVVTPWGDTAIW